ncbi:twin-arginine translocase subunit TatC [Kyrpidia tusciae]|uniref:Sec-independent protein translocase protein TatC n=1 Tax=Kyrpidia tusciae (strain DSM 2912 / NBRC 15312 / T2) TaxID=562970 RepID=D5WSC2_KYRT2|nr:twin-arginine translocase subunit TatC [Kyrpidia tusciae]ADG05007.1 Sec-independent protein translocase, TatC subunit [Kyrpidia tusciae DSM 2912]
MEAPQDQPKTFVEHLAELRKLLIQTLIVFVIALGVAFSYVDRVLVWLEIPAVRAGLGRPMVLGAGEVVRVYFMLAGVTALGVTLPFLLLQIWRFVAPGLTPRERRAALAYIPMALFIFLAGVSFGYFLVFPTVFRFLIRLGAEQFNVQITAGNYFGFMINLIVPLGLVFELPLVTMFLTRLGIVTPATLGKMRKYAYLVLVIIGAMITPPDFVSHLSVTIPMILLYELSVTVSKWVWARRQKNPDDPVEN